MHRSYNSDLLCDLWLSEEGEAVLVSRPYLKIGQTTALVSIIRAQGITSTATLRACEACATATPIPYRSALCQSKRVLDHGGWDVNP